MAVDGSEPLRLFCSRCREERAVSEFSRAVGVRGYQRWCRGCSKEYNQARRGVINEQQKARRALLPGDSGIGRYGITQEQYAELLEDQNGLCAICRQPETESGRSRLSVDHDERTLRIRGLLCARCNRGLGLGQHSLTVFTRAVAYLMSARMRVEATEKDRAWLMQCVQSARRFSTCGKAAFYSIILDVNGYQRSQGWNGPPSGAVHCIDGGCQRFVNGTKSGSGYGDCVAQHAEMGAVLRASHEYRAGGTLYVNGPPCTECSKLIVHCGLSRVVYLADEVDDFEQERLALFSLSEVLVTRVKREDLY